MAFLRAAAVVAVLAAASLLPAPARAATPDLVAAYAFSEGSGTRSADGSGNRHDATLSSVTWTTGRYGPAPAFNGSSSIARIADAADLDLSTGLTVEAWVRPTSSQSGTRTLVTKTRTGGSFPYGLELRSGVPSAFVTLGGTTQRATAATAAPVKAWTFVAATFDGTALHLYVDGKPVADRIAAGSMAASDAALEIGGNSVSGQRFKGTLDNVRLDSRALSSREVAADMSADVAAPAPAPSPTPTPSPTSTPTPTPTSTPTPPAPVPAPSSPWTTVVDDRFDAGGVPTHWRLYDGPYGSGPGNCAAPSQVSVAGGALHMLMSYRTTGTCGSGWYTAGMQLDAADAAIDQRITLRFRVVSTDPVNVRSHRILPMHFGQVQSPSWPAGGEVDYCEGSALTDCSTFAHWRNTDGTSGQYASADMLADLTSFHTIQATRRNHQLSVSLDGVAQSTYLGTVTTVPDVLQRAVLQQECRSAGCPAASLAAQSEDIQIDWITVENAT